MLDLAPLDVVHDSGVLLNRSRRTVGEDLSLAVPNGAILALAPRFGWLLYQGEGEDEDEGERRGEGERDGRDRLGLDWSGRGLLGGQEVEGGRTGAAVAEEVGANTL